MILKARNIKPSVSFGLGTFSKTLNIGQPAEVMVQQVYDADIYSISLASDSPIPSVRLSNNLFRITPSKAGNYQLHINVINKDESIQKQSNFLILIVNS